MTRRTPLRIIESVLGENLSMVTRKPPWRDAPSTPWQAEQCSARIGWISRSKSGAGSAAAIARPAKTRARTLAGTTRRQCMAAKNLRNRGTPAAAPLWQFASGQPPAADDENCPVTLPQPLALKELRMQAGRGPPPGREPHRPSGGRANTPPPFFRPGNRRGRSPVAHQRLPWSAARGAE